MTDISENKSAAVSRRNALKAGAALGVGAAALAGPQIGVLGAVPAYAAHCSAGKFYTLDFPGRNTNCGGNCGNPDIMQYHRDNESIAGPFGTVSYTMSGNGQWECSDVATLTLTAVPAGQTCIVLEVIVTDGLNGTTVVQGNGSLSMPTISQAPPNEFQCNAQYSVRLQCAPSDCFH